MDFLQIPKDSFPRVFPTLSHEEYPQVLEYEGNSEPLFSKNPRIAIVGTRNITPYGLKILQTIIPDLATKGFTIVSGGAFGVDIESQKIASHFTSKLITVLGSGLHHKAPKTNKKHFLNFINNGGCLLSPFGSDIHPTRFTFVQRNQIIASLSDLVIVIEAGPKSGSIHTANYASEQGIPVACFPGSIHSELSQGTNHLIQNGAHLVTSTEEILTLIPNHKLQNLKSTINKKTIPRSNLYDDLYQMIS